MSLLQNSNAIPTGVTGYNIENSLRFRANASAYLDRTHSSAPTLDTKGTVSVWLKLASNNRNYVIQTGAGTGNDNYMDIRFGATQVADGIHIGQYSITPYANNSSTQFRDFSGWTHLVVTYDSTSAVADDRKMKIYINGEQFTQGTFGAISQNAKFPLTKQSQAIMIGRHTAPYSYFYDGYMAEFHVIDGQALTPSDFGEYDSTSGVWKAKEYTGTYGNNGFYLDMSTSGSTVLDQSGNGNNWTANNMNLTTSTATTYDKMTDVPTLTDEDTGNFAILNPHSHSSTVKPTEGNLYWNTDVSYNTTYVSTIGVSTGKWYWEYKVGSQYIMMGVTKTAFMAYNSALSVGTYSYTTYNGNKEYNGTSGGAYMSVATNDIVGVALDLDAGTIVMYKNGVSQGTMYSGLSGTFFPHIGCPNAYSAGYINFGQKPFAYTPPTGFKKLNTYNLPDSAIKDGSEYFVTAIYTGDGASTRTIDNTITDASGIETGDPIQFSPDFVWIKNRGSTYNHLLMDSIRGADRILKSNDTGTEGTATYNNAFLSNGFYFGSASVAWNQNGVGHVMWQWRGSDSSAVSNTDGSITSTVSANTTSGFSIISYTGTGSAASVGHGLSSAPEIWIGKNRTNTSDWYFHTTIIDGSQDYLWLNLTSAKGDQSSSWYADSTKINFAGLSTPLNTSGNNHVIYAFHSVEGFSKFGSYTGNGTTPNGSFVYTGFRPAFIIVKRSDAAYGWVMFDNKRDTYNYKRRYLLANASDVEGTQVEGSGGWTFDFFSNGFRPTGGSSANAINASGGTYIYMAFAENPFKNSLAR